MCTSESGRSRSTRECSVRRWWCDRALSAVRDCDMSRVVCATDVRQGATTRLMTSPELRSLRAREDVAQTTFIEEEDGYLPACAAAARLAPHAPAQALLLERDTAGGGWRIVATRGAEAGAELRLWFSEDVLAAARFPFLTPQNIRGKRSYVCHECEEQFEEPNPLKIHLFLSCKRYVAEKFWDELLRRVETAPVAGLYGSFVLSTWPVRPASLGPIVNDLTLEALARSQSEPPATLPHCGGLGAQAEALAAAWARAAGAGSGGHRCIYCGRVYSRAYGLKIHVRTHTGYKPLRCPHCARPFGDPSNLNKHVRLHRSATRDSDIRPRHECATCGLQLPRRRDLERHCRARHPQLPDKPFSEL